MKAMMAWRCRACDGFGERLLVSSLSFKNNYNSEPEDVIEVEDTVKPEDETVSTSVYKIASLLRRLCGHEMTHALVEKKGKAKDEYYENLVRKLGNAEERAECKKLKKENWKFSPAEELTKNGKRMLWNLEVNHLFEIDLMPIELGTFDVIIGIYWLVKHDAVIVYGEKVVPIPYRNKTLIVEGEKGMSRLKVISCIKARKYIKRGCHLFLAHVTEKKPKEKRLEDVPVIRDFPEVFPDDLLGYHRRGK
ncbi:hypothetical protein Tco_0397370 [Tanacetum coccineum]